MITAPVLCDHLDMSALTGRVLLHCGWPEAAHAGCLGVEEGNIEGLITDHAYALPLAPDDTPAELRDPVRNR